MTYFFAEDKKISGKWIQLISRSMDIMDQSANQSADQSVCPWQTDWLKLASEYVRLSLTDRLTFINDLLRFRSFQKIWGMDSSYITEYGYIWRIDSTYITECGYKGSVSQPTSQAASQSVCLYLTDKLTSASRSVCLSLTDRLTEIIYIYIYMYGWFI